MDKSYLVDSVIAMSGPGVDVLIITWIDIQVEGLLGLGTKDTPCINIETI